MLYFARSMRSWTFVSLISILLTNCYRYNPPYNNFKPYHRAYVTTGPGALAGTAAWAAVGSQVLVGTGVGAAVGAGIGLYKDSKAILIKDLQKHQIKYIEYGDTVTLLVPTDKYFFFNSPRLNPICFSGLALLIKLIKLYPRCCPIYVAGFTNDVGSSYHKNKLTQAQAEAMITFLWANDIKSSRLNPEGYGDNYSVSDNKLIHGSAQNRRLEIQIFKHCIKTKPPRLEPMFGYTK